MKIYISPDVDKKLKNKHFVARDEIEQCFYNRCGKLLEDQREEHRTSPPTQWFVSETDKGRTLKVVFILQGEEIIIKTAYEPPEDAIRIYRKYAMQSL